MSLAQSPTFDVGPGSGPLGSALDHRAAPQDERALHLDFLYVLPCVPPRAVLQPNIDTLT
jgi:hypothetical protein